MFRILVVDDEENVLRAIQRIFFDVQECELRCCDNGPEAIRLAEAFAPDVIILDINMPNLDGYEVCQRIKSNTTTSGSMVLFLSGQTGLDDRLKGYAALADDYLTKPFATEELLAKVRILLRLKGAQDALLETNHNLEKIVTHRTRQLVMEERLAIVGRMVHGIIHNLQNPLMAANGFAHLINRQMHSLRQDSTQWTPEQQRTVEQVNDGVTIVIASLERAQGLVESLLRKGRKEMTGRHQPLDLNALIASEMQFLEADPKIKHGVTKEFHFDPHLPEFHGNYADFSQLCTNMVGNAVDAMQHTPTKTITISTRHDAAHIYIDFSDTGQGILPEIKEQIFEPFFSTKALKGEEQGEEPTGTGLGLYSCQQLMKEYDGTITVDSTPRLGTTFTVTLPYTEASRLARTSPADDQSI